MNEISLSFEQKIKKDLVVIIVGCVCLFVKVGFYNMSTPSKVYVSQLVILFISHRKRWKMTRQLELWELINREIWLWERSATSPALNPAYGKVTSHVKPGERRYRVADKEPKGLNPEIIVIGKANTLHFVEGSIATSAIGEGVAAS